MLVASAGWAEAPPDLRIRPGTGLSERPLLDGLVVCEFKFSGAMPGPMKRIVAAERLAPAGVSKYRACVRAFAAELGLNPGPEVAVA